MSKAENTKGFQTIFQGADGFPWKACSRQNRLAGSNPVLSAGKTGSKLLGKSESCSLRWIRNGTGFFRPLFF